MRTLTIYNYSKQPEQSLGQIQLENGTISLSGFSPTMQAELQQGIPDLKTEKWVTPDAGEVFFDLVLLRYSGAYVRAVEKTYTDILKS